MVQVGWEEERTVMLQQKQTGQVVVSVGIDREDVEEVVAQVG